MMYARGVKGVIVLNVRKLQMKTQAFFSLMILVLMVSSCTAKGGIADMAEAENKEAAEKGENIYFYEIVNFK